MASVVILAHDIAASASLMISRRVEPARGDAKEAERSRPARRNAQGKDYCVIGIGDVRPRTTRRYARYNASQATLGQKFNALRQLPYPAPPKCRPS